MVLYNKLFIINKYLILKDIIKVIEGVGYIERVAY